jgi:hypothetical protein
MEVGTKIPLGGRRGRVMQGGAGDQQGVRILMRQAGSELLIKKPETKGNDSSA